MSPTGFNLNLRAMLNGSPTNLRYVLRYSTSRCHHPENVAEHTFFVAFYAMEILRWVHSRGTLEAHSAEEAAASDQVRFASQMGRLLQRALLHDIEEAITGDVHRPFKYSDNGLRESLDRAADIAAQQVLNELIPERQHSLLPGVAEEMQRDELERKQQFDGWKHAKDGGQIGLILRFADFLSVLSFAMQEGPDAPQRLTLSVMQAHFASFQQEEYRFVWPLVDDARVLVNEVFEGGVA